MQQFETDKKIVNVIKQLTLHHNKDNLSRTEAYFNYFKSYPEIKWSFLASMVSRNSGYNMCDLEGEYFSNLLDPSFRKLLYLTYERANWLIFQDIFPQLMIYKYSTKFKRPLFHLMEYFQVSDFIQNEWEHYWDKRDENRLLTALIINEQNVIHKPVIKHPIYKNSVFHSFIFQMEDWFHFSCVLFPTCEGKVYGASVNGFRKVDKRIDLGKRLANILFQPQLFPDFFVFAEKQTHTGSRYDYERYFSKKNYRKTPYLRTAFPIISHHLHNKVDWSLKKKVPHSWLFGDIIHKHPIQLNDWYEKKQSQIQLLVALNQLIK
ncbi:DUF2515 family protein [Bacillus sp. CGMCC 1.16607]|uniref:DUF2515 family protein n=1 Tax=Bacillus sp. CGMCC 1.16607 TaxID=3351842 RepID=UPI003634B2A8